MNLPQVNSRKKKKKKTEFDGAMHLFAQNGFTFFSPKY